MVQKILNEDIQSLKISSLPTRPTAPTSFGGKGYTSAEMKAAFDKLPLYIVERFNELIELIVGEGEESITESIPTGIKEGHTLRNLLDDIKSGEFSSYLNVYGNTLVERLERLISDIGNIKRDMGTDYTAPEFVILDCGRPSQREEGGLQDAQ